MDKLKYWFKTGSIKTQTVLFGVALFLIAVIFKHNHVTTNITDDLINVASFLFATFIAFSISNSRDKMSTINQTLKTDEANFLTIYKHAKEISHGVQQKAQGLIDEHFIDQIDYRLTDYRLSGASFNKIEDYFLDLTPKTEEAKIAHNRILDLLAGLRVTRWQVEMLVQQTMSEYEWLSVLSLFAFICFHIIISSSGTLASMLLSSFIGATLLLFILVLRDLNNLRWQEQKWIWDPLTNFFKDLNLLPYYPGDAITEKRVELKQGEKVRVADYPDPYPDMTNKEVRVIEVE